MVRWWMASLVLLAGCGSGGEPRTGSDREQVEAAMIGYLDALAEGDGEEACRHVAEQAQRDLATIMDAGSCAEGIEKLHEALNDEQCERRRAIAARRDGGGERSAALTPAARRRTRRRSVMTGTRAC